MSKWKSYKIQDVGEVITGHTPPTSQREYYGGQYKFIKPTDMREGQRYVPETEEYYSELAYKKYKKSLLPIGTPCVVTIGSLGKKMCLTDEPCFTNQAVNAVVPNEHFDGVFLYYCLRTRLSYVKQLDSGTTSGRENVSKSSFSGISLDAPDLKEQRKIGEILSTYDSLIENNNKRIKILEQMAENLYKEWFVRFRFPGHETTQFENGIPKGWKKGRLSDICCFLRGKNITSEEMIEGIYPVIAAGIEPSGFHNEANVKGVSVTISNSGANAGYLSIHYSDIWAADCSYVSKTNVENIFFVYEMLRNISSVIMNLQRGAAQPHVYAKDVNNLKLYLPTKDLMIKANKRFENLHQQISILAKQNKILVKQRNLLLPRLMSGKLAV